MFYCNVAGWVVHRKCKLVVLRSCLPWKMQGVGTSPKGSYIFGPLVFEHFWCWKTGLCGICMDLWGFHSFALCACFTAMLLGGWCIENVSWWSWGPVFHEKCRGWNLPKGSYIFGPLVFEHFWCWKMGLCGICMDLWGFHSFALCACFTDMLLGGWCIENVSWWSWGPVFHEKCRGLEPPPRDLTFSVPSWSLNIFGVGRWDYVGFVWICGVSIPLHFVHVLLQCCWHQLTFSMHHPRMFYCNVAGWVVHRKCKLVVLRSCLPWKMQGLELPQGILHFRSLGLWTFLVLEHGIMWDLYGFVGFPFLCTLCMFYCNVAGWCIENVSWWSWGPVFHEKCRGLEPPPRDLTFSVLGLWTFLVLEDGIMWDLYGFVGFPFLCTLCMFYCNVAGWCIENVSWWSWGPVFHEKCRGLEPPPRDLTFSVPWSLNIFGVGRWDYVGFIWICGVSIPLHFVHVLLQCCWVVHRKCKLVVLRSCLPWKMQGVGTSPKGSYMFGPLVFEHFWCWKMGLCGICMDLWGFHSFALCACFTAMLLGGA